MASIAKYSNNFSTVLTQNASSVSSTLYLETVQGLPDITGGDYFRLTIKRESDGLSEIIKVTSVNAISKAVTVTRGEESTTPISFVIGDTVQLRMTAGALNYITTELDRVVTAEDSIVQTALDIVTAVDSTTQSAAEAQASAEAAALSETNSLQYKNDAEAAKGLAETAAQAAIAVYDDFDDRYLGAKAVAPTLDNDGNPLITGALYFDTNILAMLVWNGSSWGLVASSDYVSKANGGTFESDITVIGTVNGRNMTTDGNKLDGIEAGATSDQTASEVPFTPTGSISSTNVQAAIAELGTEKEPADVTILKSASIGVTVQPYNAATAFTNTANTWTQQQTFKEIRETVYTVTGTTPALNPLNGSVQLWTLAGNSTPTEALEAGQYITLMINDGTNYTITWPTITWVNNGGIAPTLAITGYTVVALWKAGTTLYGALVGDGS